MKKPIRDQLYAQPNKKIIDFVFDEDVANVLPDMLQRSVPGYSSIVSLIALLGKKFAQADSFCYDLGCSYGSVAQELSNTITVTNCDIIAVDNSPPLISRCRQNLKQTPCPVPVHLICADILNIKTFQASVIVLNFTLQFIDPSLRDSLIGEYYSGLVNGGALIVSEKINIPDKHDNDQLKELHVFFKKANGYSDLEISQKRLALENVLIPETIEDHLNRFKKAGFSTCLVWYQCFNFVSFLAIK